MSYNIPRILNNLNYEINNRDELTFINSNDEHKIPHNNNIKIYSKADSNIYKLDDLGNETILGSGGGGGTGNVIGPSDSINDSVCFFNGTSGRVIKQNADVKYQPGFLIVPDLETSYTFSLNDELKKIQNINSATENITNINGLIRVPEIAVERVYHTLQSTYIELDASAININATEVLINSNDAVYTPYDNTLQTLELKTDTIKDITDTSIINLNSFEVDVITSAFKYNGSEVATIGNIPSITALEQKTQNISSSDYDYTQIEGNLNVTNTIQSGSISSQYVYDESKSVRIAIDSTTFDVQAQYLKFNGNNVVSTPYPSLLEATSFKRTGGTSLQFLKANGDVDGSTYLTSTDLTTLQTKTQNQTATAGTTTFNGTLDATTKIQTALISDRTVGTANIYLTAGLIEITGGGLLFNNSDVIYNTYPNTLQALNFQRTGGVFGEFLKGNGFTDINSYNNTQYLMTTAPAIISNTTVETALMGTGLTTNNMSMTWNDALNYSRNIYITGTIRYLASAVLTIRLRVGTGGTIKIPWVITLPTLAQATLIPFIMKINYTIFTPNLYVASSMLNIAGVVPTSSFIFNSSQACNLLNTSRTVSAQWGAASPLNQLTITQFMIKNNFIG